MSIIMRVSSFSIKTALAAAIVVAGTATGVQAASFGGHGFGGAGFAGRGVGGGFARPAFGGGFAQRGFAGGGLITGRSVGFARPAAFGPRFGTFNRGFAFNRGFGFHRRFARRGFGFGVPLALAGVGLGYGLASYAYDYPYDDDYGDCYLRRSWYGGYPHLVQVCY
ncbi:MAG: hypothetical protein NVSMB26_11210 [Beijerinckiaceae bacterium]